MSGIWKRPEGDVPLAGAAVPEAVPIPPPKAHEAIARARELWQSSSPSAFAHPERQSLSGTMIQALEGLHASLRKTVEAGYCTHLAATEIAEVVNAHTAALQDFSERLAKIEDHLGLLS